MKHKLLVAVDGEKTSWKTAIYVGRACASAKSPFCEVVVYHVLPEFPSYAAQERVTPELLESFESETRMAGKILLAEMKARIAREGVKPELITTELSKARGSVAAQILATARAHHCDTIVLGRRGKSMIGQFFMGSVVEKILRNPTGLTTWVVE